MNQHNPNTALKITTLAFFAALLCAQPAIAAEQSAEVLFDGTQIASWNSARTPERLAKEFSVSELAAVRDPAALQWRFVSRGVNLYDIYQQQPIKWEFETVSVWLKNEGAEFTCSAKMTDAGGAEWTTPLVKVAGGGDWQWLEFPRAQWHVASWSKDSNGKLDFPAKYFALIASDIKEGTEYKVKVRRLECVRAAASTVVAKASPAVMPTTVAKAQPEIAAEVLFDGTQIASWNSARTPERLAKEFSVSELAAVRDPAALQWRFVSRGVNLYDIYQQQPIKWEFETVRVWLKNEGAEFTCSAKMTDAGGAEWTTPLVKVAGGGDWQWLEFPRAQWHVASWSKDSNGKLDFPAKYFALIASDIKEGTEYKVKVRRLESVRAAASAVSHP